MQLGNTVNAKIVKLEKKISLGQENMSLFPAQKKSHNCERVVFVLPKGRIQSSGLILFPPGLLFSKSKVKWHIINTF